MGARRQATASNGLSRTSACVFGFDTNALTSLFHRFDALFPVMNALRLLGNACSYVAMVFLLAGCAVAYRAPGSEDASLTGLAVVYFKDDSQLGIVTQVDKLPRPNWNVSRYELPPGQHTFQISVNDGFNIVELTVKFDVVAGNDYQIAAAVTSTQEMSSVTKITIVNRTTGQVVPREVRIVGLSIRPGALRGD